MYMVVPVASGKLVVVGLIGKKRLHTGNLKFHLDAGRKACDKGRERCPVLFFVVQCRADCCKQVRIFRCDRMLVIQIQCADERCLKFR